MGTSVSCIGTCYSITDEEELTQRTMKLLHYGGMMNLGYVDIYGKQILLLHPLKIFPGGKVYFGFNYFEDRNWEQASFNADSCYWISGKIGENEFCSVIVAAYVLHSYYVKGSEFVTINDRIIDPAPYVAWINHLLKTNYNLDNRFKLWDKAEGIAYYDECREDREPFTYETLDDFLPENYPAYKYDPEYLDLCYVTQGTRSLQKHTAIPGTYSADVFECKVKLRKFFKDATDTDALGKLWQLVQMNRKERQNQTDDSLKEIARLSLFLPARVIVYLASEIKNEYFWDIWEPLCDKVYHDEIMKTYMPTSWLKKRKAVTRAPYPGLTTCDFLQVHSIYDFFNTPEELQDKPQYRFTDDDRLYWWDDTEEVVISTKMDEWLKDLAQQHAELMKKPEEKIKQATAQKQFIDLLCAINDYYKRIYPFNDMFHEFLTNVTNKEYRASVDLMQRLYEENKEEGAVVKYVTGDWDLASKQVTCNEGRMRLKRIMGVMANKKLRMKYFGF